MTVLRGHFHNLGVMLRALFSSHAAVLVFRETADEIHGWVMVKGGPMTIDQSLRTLRAFNELDDVKQDRLVLEARKITEPK